MNLLSPTDLRRIQQEDEAARQGDDDDMKAERNCALHRMSDGRSIVDYEAFLGKTTASARCFCATGP
jgi:hypothetical protein